LLCLLAALPARSQEARGAIIGRVTDAQNAVVPNATIQVTNVANGVTLNLKSNDQGNYEALFLLLGSYRITAEAKGFKKVIRDGVEVRVNDRLEINLVLEVGSITEVVTVAAETPLLETATASMGSVVDSRRVADLPIAHGEPYALMALSGGVTFAGDPALDRPFEPSHIANYSMGGTRGLRNELSLDGAPAGASTANAGEVSASYVPPTDILAEMKVSTAAFDATIGQSEGGSVSLSVKSGTNQFHGTTYWYKMSPDWWANNWFSNKNGQPRADFDYNRWGGSFMGPVYLPKLYNGRNRTFFTYGYEGIHETRPRGTTTTVPTEAERRGDFSALLKIGNQYQLYDPATRAPAASGRFSELPIAGNIIPASRISPIATNILKYYAMPNVAGTADGSNNLALPNAPEAAKYYTHTWRLDHNISEKFRVFGRASWYNRQSTYNDWFQNIATGEWFAFHSVNAAFDTVYMLSASSVLNLRYGYNRFIRDVTRNPAGLGFDLTSLGLPKSWNDAIPPDIRRFPYINISGYYGTNGTVLWRPQDTHDFNAQIDRIHGGHGMKFGVQYRIYRKNQINPDISSTGQLAFDTSYTRGPLDNSTSAPLGQGLASLLLGVTTGGGVDRRASFAERSNLWGFFFQDDWKATRKLTVTLGLRYELEAPLSERWNRSVRGFDPNATLSITSAAQAAYAKNPTAEIAASAFKAQGGLLFAGVNGQPETLWNRQTKNFMPRVGLAYSLDKKTVLRAGYGVFFTSMGLRRGDVIQSGYSFTTSLVPTLDNGLTFIANLANPFPNGVTEPVGATAGVNTFLGQGVTAFNADLKTPYMQRWQFGVQRELPGRVVLETSYVGNRGTRIEINHDLNAIPTQYLSTSPTRDQARIDYLSTNLPNPFAGLLPGTSRNGSTISRQTLFSAYPQFTSVTTSTNQGYSWYHSLQIKADKRFSRGFTLQGTYTWSKFMQATEYLNGSDPRPTEVISDQDFPHRLAASGIWELPFGRGRKLASNVGRGVNMLVNGWQVQGIYTFQSGGPLAWSNYILYGAPDQIVLPSSQRSAEQWFSTSSSLWERATNRQLSNNVRTFPIRFPGIRSMATNNWDFSVIKNTKPTEKLNIQFRAESLNVFNHQTFAGPNTTPTSTAFGTVTAIRGYPRRLQIGVKAIF
jgi:hypothetical protein